MKYLRPDLIFKMFGFKARKILKHYVYCTAFQILRAREQGKFYFGK